MVYGMTGGQISGLSPSKFKEAKMPEASGIPPYDICNLAFSAGAGYCARAYIGKGLHNPLKEAINHMGFSLVEVLEMCPSHGVRKVSELKEMSQQQETTLIQERKPLEISSRKTKSLFDSLPVVKAKFKSLLNKRLEVIIAGSAGEGIQSAGDLLSMAAMTSGLKTTKKGEYPITVGTGFSMAEVILSPEEINYTGIEIPDILFILSSDGYQKVKSLISSNVTLVVDSSLDISFIGKTLKGDFRKLAGKKGAALCAIATWLDQEKAIPHEALLHAAQKHKHADKFIKAIRAGLTADLIS